MRFALFSDHERKMAKHYLETEEKGEGFRVLAHRVRKAHPQIREDYDIMNRLLTKLGFYSDLE